MYAGGSNALTLYIFEMSGVCLRFWLWAVVLAGQKCFCSRLFFYILSLLFFPSNNNGSGCVSVVCCWKWCVLPSSLESSSSWNRAASTFHHYDYYYYDHIEFASFHHIITSWVGLMMSMMFIPQHHILILHMQPTSEYLISYQHHHKSLLHILRTVGWCSVLPSSKLSLAEIKLSPEFLVFRYFGILLALFILLPF